MKNNEEVLQMMKESRSDNRKRREMTESFMVRLTDPMVYDKLNILCAEYSVSAELLINEAVRRLLDDIAFVRSLRTGTSGLRQPANCLPDPDR